MQWLTPWERLSIYFRKRGVPREILNTICISQQEAAQISHLIKHRRPRSILEVGTFIGLSTGVIALSKNEDSMLVCVDPDFPVKSITAGFRYFEERSTLSFVKTMLKQFGVERQAILLRGFFSRISAGAREQLIVRGVDPEQVPVIGATVGKYAPYDLVFIDGDHHADAVVSDLALIAPHMARDGIIVMHDVSHRWGEQVREGIARFMQAYPFYTLQTDGNLGFLSRDAEKICLVRQEPPTFVKRVRWKLIRVLCSAN